MSLEAICAAEHLLSSQPLQWQGDGAALLHSLPREIWSLILSFVDPWTLVGSVSCASIAFQQLFRIEVQTKSMRKAFHLDKALAKDAAFIRDLVVVLQVLDFLLQHPIQIPRMLLSLQSSKPFVLKAMNNHRAFRYIACRYPSLFYESFNMGPLIVQLVASDGFVNPVLHHRLGLLLFTLREACSRLGATFPWHSYWDPYLRRASSEIHGGKESRRLEKSRTISRQRRGQPYTIEQRHYSENLHSLVMIRQGLLKGIHYDIDVNLETISMRFDLSSVRVTAQGDMIIYTSLQGDALIDETSLYVRYLLSPSLDSNVFH